MNAIAVLNFSREDRQQFAQLIGYSLAGYKDLRYVDEKAYAEAASTVKKPTVSAEDSAFYEVKLTDGSGDVATIRLYRAGHIDLCGNHKVKVRRMAKRRMMSVYDTEMPEWAKSLIRELENAHQRKTPRT